MNTNARTMSDANAKADPKLKPVKPKGAQLRMLNAGMTLPPRKDGRPWWKPPGPPPRQYRLDRNSR